MNQVSINIVTWNSIKFLPECLESIRKQTYRDFSVLIIDNGSDDGSLDFIKGNYSEYSILRNIKNLGFCRAHNQGIEYVVSHIKLDNADSISSHYIMLMNPDVILEPDFLEILVGKAREYSYAASFGGKLLRAFSGEDQNLESQKSNIMDSAGICIYKNRSAKDRGGSEEDRGQFEKEEEVFGVSGALVLYRADALYKARIGREYFDEDFFMYKDDVDMAWRLRNFGWSAIYVPEARGYHYRSASPPLSRSISEYLKTRKNRSKRANFFSYRNHLLTILKNDYLINLVLHLPFVVFYELKKILFLIIFEPRTLLALPSFLAKTPKILAKRKEIFRRTVIKPKEIRQWFK